MRNINSAFRTGFIDTAADWFAIALLDWYQVNKRDLPWRETKEPFHIWLSEIILQQTRVNQGLPYYNKFVDHFENIEAFAKADLNLILKLWQGLGYYSRARNMHQCAQMVIEDFDGAFPDTYDDLQKLKGVGKYTAAAIGSICFDEAVPTIDGNVFRVLSRVFGISDDISKSGSFKVFFEKAKTLIPSKNPGDFNQAMMEFGAIICTPKSPACEECVLSTNCFAKKNELINTLPVKSKNVKVKHRYFNYHVFTNNQQILMRKRRSGDIWTGLFEFDLNETEKSLKCSNFEDAEFQYSTAEVVHQLTHQKLHIKFHVYESNVDVYEQLAKTKNLTSVAINELDKYAVPKPIESFLDQMFCQ